MTSALARHAVLAAVLIVLGTTGSVAAQSPDTLSIEEAIRLSVARSPVLRQAEAAELQASGGEWDGFGRLLPSVSVSTGLNRSEALQRTANDPITGGIVELPDSLVDQRRTFGTSLSVGASWTVFDGGRGISQVGAARQSGRAADAALAAARVRVTADVILAYLDALEAEALGQVRRKEAERDAELERTARARHELGAVPEVDLLQAELAASNAELAVLDAEGAARLARMRLLELIGFVPDPEVELLPPPEPGPIGDEAALRAVVFSESTVLAESEARLAAARWDARGRRLGFLPSVSLGFSWSRSEFGGTRDAFTFEPRNSQTAFRLSASWNALGQPLGLVGDRLRAEATEVAANAEHETAKGALEREVIAGADRLERARILRDRIGVTLALAERQLAQAEERYRLGLAPLAERLTAETLWAEAARQEVAARYAPLRAVAQLERATGVAFWLAELR